MTVSRSRYAGTPSWQLRGPLDLLKRPVRCAEYYRMSSTPISINLMMLRTAAAINRDTASEYDNYRARCQAWLADAEAEIVRCNGVIAAPVARCLPEFFSRVTDQTAATVDQHVTMGDKLVAAAAGYEHTDNGGAAGVMAVGVV